MRVRKRPVMKSLVPSATAARALSFIWATARVCVAASVAASVAMGAAASVAAGVAGCGETAKRVPLEDQSRKVAPLPACVMYLPARRAETAGTMRKLKEEQIVHLMFPAFDEEKRSLAQAAASCTGHALLDAPPLAGGQPEHGWPFVEQEGDVVYGSGGDRIKVVWLRMLGFPDGTVGGPLAIVRSTERFAELFAIGAYKGRADRVKIGTQRMGAELLVIAEEDDCAGRKAGAACENHMTVFLPRRGALAPVVEVPVERVAYVAQGERGATGTLEYRLTTAADYREDGIHVVEQIRVKDENGRELRKAELERLFVMDDAGHMASSEPPLWERVVKPEARPDAKPEVRPGARETPDVKTPPRRP
jgi:hypothetical protein